MAPVSESVFGPRGHGELRINPEVEENWMPSRYDFVPS